VDIMAQPLSNLPKVDLILGQAALAAPLAQLDRAVVLAEVRRVLDGRREALRAGADPALDPAAIAAEAARRLAALARGGLRGVINATGVVLHTNLGRAPLGRSVAAALATELAGYSNLEFDLDHGRRGNRNGHLSGLLAAAVGCQASLVVNNNAAALLLTLRGLAAGREVVISRGELIEIGGCFRIPEIIESSGARLVEVGTTNRTRAADYERAITERTALILKAHTSNFVMRGFTESVAVADLAAVAHRHGLPLVYDQGSGLLRRLPGLPLADEPVVAEAVAAGADLVTFSGDKLLGGPQAGIIVGREDLVARLAQDPLMRALRVGKLTIAALAAACRAHLGGGAGLAIHELLGRPPAVLEDLARRLAAACTARGLPARVIADPGSCGGGTTPELEIPSFAVVLDLANDREDIAHARHLALMAAPQAVVAILRQGRLLFNVLALFEDQVEPLADAVAAVRRAEA
jgi:L-seryl-tRNA(Ser) seleniumtransferase